MLAASDEQSLCGLLTLWFVQPVSPTQSNNPDSTAEVTITDRVCRFGRASWNSGVHKIMCCPPDCCFHRFHVTYENDFVRLQVLEALNR